MRLKLLGNPFLVCMPGPFKSMYQPFPLFFKKVNYVDRSEAFYVHVIGFPVLKINIAFTSLQVIEI